ATPDGAATHTVRSPLGTRLAALRRAGSLHRRDVRHGAGRLSCRAHSFDYRSACVPVRIASSPPAARDAGADNCLPRAPAGLLSASLADARPPKSVQQRHADPFIAEVNHGPRSKGTEISGAAGGAGSGRGSSAEAGRDTLRIGS